MVLITTKPMFWGRTCCVALIPTRHKRKQRYNKSLQVSARQSGHTKVTKNEIASSLRSSQRPHPPLYPLPSREGAHQCAILFANRAKMIRLATLNLRASGPVVLMLLSGSSIKKNPHLILSFPKEPLICPPVCHCERSAAISFLLYINKI